VEPLHADIAAYTSGYTFCFREKTNYREATAKYVNYSVVFTARLVTNHLQRACGSSVQNSGRKQPSLGNSAIRPYKIGVVKLLLWKSENSAAR
jgi:hypothetical protein